MDIKTLGWKLLFRLQVVLVGTGIILYMIVLGIANAFMYVIGLVAYLLDPVTYKKLLNTIKTKTAKKEI